MHPCRRNVESSLMLGGWMVYFSQKFVKELRPHVNMTSRCTTTKGWHWSQCWLRTGSGLASLANDLKHCIWNQEIGPTMCVVQEKIRQTNKSHDFLATSWPFFTTMLLSQWNRILHLAPVETPCVYCRNYGIWFFLYYIMCCLLRGPF